MKAPSLAVLALASAAFASPFIFRSLTTPPEWRFVGYHNAITREPCPDPDVRYSAGLPCVPVWEHYTGRRLVAVQWQRRNEDGAMVVWRAVPSGPYEQPSWTDEEVK